MQAQKGGNEPLVTCCPPCKGSECDRKPKLIKMSNLSLSALIAAASFQATAANADPPRVDLFSNQTPFSFSGSKTPKSVAPDSGSNISYQEMEQKAAVKWFEQYDALRAKYRPTRSQRVILSRPLMQQEERVNEWTMTAAKVSKSYLSLCKLLKQLPVPPQTPDLKEFRDLTADWYGDAATIFDDMIRPRSPAKTIEDLQRQLDQVKCKSQTLIASTSSLSSMDQDLRKQYKVPLAIQDDALGQFADNKPIPTTSSSQLLRTP